MARVAPNLTPEIYLWRPILADPPLCSIYELKTILTIDDLADLHEAMDLKEATAERARANAERKNRHGR
ncbi:MAG TPA: hypothetical protein VIL30_14645 [Ramlibacter sp.]